MTGRREKAWFGRLWLLFALVATALVWSWSQVFQHSPRSDQTEADQVALLRTEPGCDLDREPCAAYGGQLALVASAQRDGEGVRWRAKLVGEGLPPQLDVQLGLLAPSGVHQALPTLRTADHWQARSAATVASGSVLQVRLQADGRLWMAEFPLGRKR
jgi:hypothetical protein